MDNDYRKELIHSVAEWKSILRKAERVGAVSRADRVKIMDYIGRIKQVLYTGMAMPEFTRPVERRYL